MRYLLIKNGVVVNAIEATADVISTLTGYDEKIQTNQYDIGYAYANGVFTMPPPRTPIKAALTQLEFLRRFTAQERITIRASSDPIIVDFLHLLNLAQDVRTDDADTSAGVNYLETMGLIDQGRAAQILV